MRLAVNPVDLEAMKQALNKGQYRLKPMQVVTMYLSGKKSGALDSKNFLKSYDIPDALREWLWDTCEGLEKNRGSEWKTKELE